MSGTVSSSTTNQYTSGKVYEEVAIFKQKGWIISDKSAMAIAAWHQSPGYMGKIFAQLASTGQCDEDEVVEAIHTEINDAGWDRHTKYPLQALEAWCRYQAEEWHRLLCGERSQIFDEAPIRKQDL